MKITLDANPSDAPCCLKIIADDGRDLLVQTDWDWPGIASTFGFSLASVQKCDKCGKTSEKHFNRVVKFCPHCINAVGFPGTNVGSTCHHSATDGTIDCPECGIRAGEFISAARQWMADNDGAQADDPGYFDGGAQ